MKRALRVAAAAAIAAFLAAPGLVPALAQEATPDRKLVFKIGWVNDIDSMNPFNAYESPAYETFFLQYDLLVNFGAKDLGPAPGLATDWEVSPDGLTWTFTIRDGVKWHDGEPFTAEDVKFTFDRIINDPQPFFSGYVHGITGVDVVDGNKVVFTSEYPRAQALAMWVPILPEHVWGEFDKKEMRQFSNDPTEVGPLVGTGPFQVIDWDKGQSWSLRANEDYWGGAPHIDEVIFQVFKNEEAMVAALRTGAIDMAFSIPAGLFNELKGDPNIVTHDVSTSSSFSELGFNLGAVDEEGRPLGDGHPALQDLRFRRAIAHAIDKQALVDRVLLGYGTIGYSVIPPASSLYHWVPTEEEVIGFDPELAKQILEDAGYRDVDGDGFREHTDGQPMDLRFYVRSESPDTVKAGEFISEWLADVGIKTTVRAISDGKLATVILDGEYDLFIWGWGVEPDPDFQLSVFTKEQFGNWSDSWYHDPEYEEMYVLQKRQVDLAERAETVKAMQKQLYDEVVYVVLWYDQELQAYRGDRWTGMTPSPEPDGYLMNGYNNYNYLNVRPVTEEARPEPGPGIPPAAWIAILAGAAIVIAAVLLGRRRAREEERV